MWQFYLPRLPSMHPLFPAFPLRHVWFNGFIGQFGWLDYGFAHWVYNLALLIFAGIVGLAARELVRVRTVVRARIGELITYLTLIAGLLVLIGGVSYIARIEGRNGLRAAALSLSPARAVRRPDRARPPAAPASATGRRRASCSSASRSPTPRRRCCSPSPGTTAERASPDRRRLAARPRRDPRRRAALRAAAGGGAARGGPEGRGGGGSPPPQAGPVEPQRCCRPSGGPAASSPGSTRARS